MVVAAPDAGLQGRHHRHQPQGFVTWAVAAPEVALWGSNWASPDAELVIVAPLLRDAVFVTTVATAFLPDTEYVALALPWPDVMRFTVALASPDVALGASTWALPDTTHLAASTAAPEAVRVTLALPVAARVTLAVSSPDVTPVALPVPLPDAVLLTSTTGAPGTVRVTLAALLPEAVLFPSALVSFDVALGSSTLV